MFHLRTSLAAAAAALVLVGTGAIAEQKTGNFALTLNQVYGTTQTGAYSAAGTAFCQGAMGAFLNTSLTGSYDIDTSTLIMSATAEYMEASVDLYPLGLTGSYTFMSDGVPASLQEKDIDRIIVAISLDFTSIEGDVMIVPGGDYNCVVSNMPYTG